MRMRINNSCRFWFGRVLSIILLVIKGVGSLRRERKKMEIVPSMRYFNEYLKYGKRNSSIFFKKSLIVIAYSV